VLYTLKLRLGYSSTVLRSNLSDLHTLQVKCVDCEAESVPLRQVYYQSAIDRLRPNAIELLLTLPPKSTTRLSIAFERTYIKITEHYPDENHGFDIGSGIVSVDGRRMYTDPLLIRLPTPDFSMPYNVITLTCTVLGM
jgi:GPI-anchor transamidase subunit T